MNRCLSAAFVTIGMMLLTACEATIPAETLPELTFRHLKPIALNVTDIQFVDNRQANRRDTPDAGYKFPISPRVALLRWAKARLQVAGLSGTARFVVHRAHVTETRLQIDRGIGGLFKKENSERYHADLEASMEIYDERNIRRAFASARTRETTTIREDASPNERRRIWLAMVERLMASFDRVMDARIREHMAGYMQ